MACVGAWKRAQPRKWCIECEACGVIVNTVKPMQRFCSVSCQSKHNWKVNRPKMEKSLEALVISHSNPTPKMKEWQRSPLNPIYDPAVRRKGEINLRERGFLNLNGGNGRVASLPQRLLAARLAWPMEHVVTTGEGWRPHHYKIDIAEPTLLVAVEVDGESHRASRIQAADRRKDLWLKDHGWTVHRVTNKEVLKDLEQVAQRILSSI